MAIKTQSSIGLAPKAWGAGLILCAITLVWIWAEADWSFNRLWVTEAQATQRHLAAGDYEGVLAMSGEPFARGGALYRLGEFKAAGAEFQRLSSPEAAYNLGNTLVFQGEYEAAIEAYSRALEMRPDWEEPLRNSAICTARLAALAPPEDDYGGTGGQLRADKIVFDDRAKGSSGNQTEEVENEGGRLSQQEMRALWLRRVQTRPADFLKSKFSYQLQAGEGS